MLDGRVLLTTARWGWGLAGFKRKEAKKAGLGMALTGKHGAKLGLGSSSIRLDYTNPKKDRKVYEKYINPHYVFLSDVPFLSFAGLQLPGLTQYATIDICHTYAPTPCVFV